MEKVRVLNLDAPYFSAYKKYGWETGTWGLGISIRFLNAAAQAGEDVVVVYNSQHRKYEWFAKLADLRTFAEKNYPAFRAGQTQLLVFPVTIFKEVTE